MFVESGFDVTGIEISETAIRLARENGLKFPIHHGSVVQMPLDDSVYDGIYCYALIHLLNQNERRQFLKNCYNQLREGGIIFFSVSKNYKMFGQGKPVNKDRFRIQNGLDVFFYDSTESGTTGPVLVIQTNLLNKVSHPSTIICPITTKVMRTIYCRILHFTHPEARFIGLPPSLREERGKNTKGVTGVSHNNIRHYFILITNVQNESEILRVHLKKGMANLHEHYDIMIDQIRAIDNKRLIKKVGDLPSLLISEVKENIGVVLDLE